MTQLEQKAKEYAKYNIPMPQDMMTTKWQQGRYEGFKAGAEWMLNDALNTIDWEQRRYEIAKDIMSALLVNSCPFTSENKLREYPKCAVEYADSLIKELKKDEK